MQTLSHSQRIYQGLQGPWVILKFWLQTQVKMHTFWRVPWSLCETDEYSLQSWHELWLYLYVSKLNEKKNNITRPEKKCETWYYISFEKRMLGLKKMSSIKCCHSSWKKINFSNEHLVHWNSFMILLVTKRGKIYFTSDGRFFQVVQLEWSWKFENSAAKKFFAIWCNKVKGCLLRWIESGM